MSSASSGMRQPGEALSVQGRAVGSGEPAMIIGEVGLAHDGSLGLAHAFVDAIARSGADCVKFQTHIAGEESTTAEPFRVHFSRQDSSRYEYWERTAFTAEQWLGLSKHARDAGLIFLSSPFSNAAVDLLDRIDTPAWKIGSGEVSNDALLRHVAATGKPVLLSSGLSDLAELDHAVDVVRRGGAPLGVFQCASRYPCPAEALGLEQIRALGDRYSCPVGLSDHSGTIYAGLGAIVLGASMLEVHVTLSREMFGPDVVASLTTAELKQLVEGVRFLESALRSPIDKSSVGATEQELRAIFTKSIVAARGLNAGIILAEGDLALKKPGTGTPARLLPDLLGRRLRRAVKADEQITMEDVEAVGA